MAKHTRSHTGESDSTGSSTEVDRTPQPTWCPAFKEAGGAAGGHGALGEQSSLDGLGISTPTTLEAPSPRSHSPVTLRSSPPYAYRPGSGHTPSHSPTSTRPGHARRASRISVSTKGHSRGTSVSSSSGPLDAFPSQDSIARRDARDSFVGLPYKQPGFDYNESFLLSNAASAQHSKTQSDASSLSSSDMVQHGSLPAISSHRKYSDENKRRSLRDSASGLSDHSTSSSRSSLTSLTRLSATLPEQSHGPPEASYLDQRSKSLPGGPLSSRAHMPAPLPPGFTILLDRALRPNAHEVFPRRESAPLPTLLARRENFGARAAAVQLRDDSPLLIDSPPDRPSHCLDAPVSPLLDDQNATDPYSEINWSSFIESGYSMSFTHGAMSPLHVARAAVSGPQGVVIDMERGFSNESNGSHISPESRAKPASPLSEQVNFIDTSLANSDNEDAFSEEGLAAGLGNSTLASQQPIDPKVPLRPTGIDWLDDELMADQSPDSPVSVGFSRSPPAKTLEIDSDAEAEAPWMTPPEKPAKLMGEPVEVRPVVAAQSQQQAHLATRLLPRHQRAQRLGLGLNVHKANHNPASLALRKLSPITPPPRTALPPTPGPVKHFRRARGASISFSPSHNAASHFPDVDVGHRTRRRPSTGTKPPLRSKDSFNSSKRQSEADLFGERSPIPEEGSESLVVVPEAKEQSPRAQTSLGFAEAHVQSSLDEEPTPTTAHPPGTSTSPSRRSRTSPARPPRHPSRPSSSDTKASHNSTDSHHSSSSAQLQRRKKKNKEALDAFLASPPPPNISGRNASLTKYSKMMSADVAGATPPRRSLALPTTFEPTPADRAANLRRLRLMGEEGGMVEKNTKVRSRSGSTSSVANQTTVTTTQRPAKMKERLSVLLNAPSAPSASAPLKEKRASSTSVSSTSGSSGNHSAASHSVRQSTSRQTSSTFSSHHGETSLGSMASSTMTHSTLGDDGSSEKHIPIYPPSASRPSPPQHDSSTASSTLAMARMNVPKREAWTDSSSGSDQQHMQHRRSLDSDHSFPATVSIHSIGSGHSSRDSTGAASATQGYLGLGMWTGSVGAGAHTSLPSTAGKPRTRFAPGSLGRKSSVKSKATSSGSTTYSNNSATQAPGRKSLSDFFDRAHFLESLSASAGEQQHGTAGTSSRPSMSRPSLNLLFGGAHGGRDHSKGNGEDQLVNPFHFDESYYLAQEQHMKKTSSDHLIPTYPAKGSHPPSSFTRSANALNRPAQRDARAREEEMMAALDSVLPGGVTRRRGRADSVRAAAQQQQQQNDLPIGRASMSEAHARPMGHLQRNASDDSQGRKQPGWIRKRASKLIG